MKKKVIFITEVHDALPNWYKTYISFYCNGRFSLKQLENGQKDVHMPPSLKEIYWESMAMLMPYCFESYAIILHQPNQHLYGGQGVLKTRQDIYQAYGIKFDPLDALNIETYAAFDEIMWRSDVEIAGWDVDKLQNGECSIEQFDFTISCLNTFQNQDIFYHYGILKSIAYGNINNDFSKKDYRLFKGNSLLDYAELVETVGINTQPDGIFCGQGKWAIITDYDQPYTFIGGSLDLIDSVISTTYDIYRIQPKYKVEFSAIRPSN
ncbi:MAG: hypothetical protein ACN6NV_10900 [Acinetobacter gandensis]|uniref:hypothetical protein n=1 Tax=Acinetobacter gandensis TaxID=1443941 RepID=UPI003CFD3F9C